MVLPQASYDEVGKAALLEMWCFIVSVHHGNVYVGFEGYNL